MKMEKFVKLMTGHFDNREQFTEMKSAGKIISVCPTCEYSL